MKKVLLGAILLFSSFGFSQVPNNVPTDGLVGFYDFNGNANDLTTKTNNGIVYGATLTTDRFGNVNSAYSFDGINDFILLNNFFTKGNNQKSVSIWFNSNDDNYSWIIDGGISSYGNSFGLFYDAVWVNNRLSFHGDSEDNDYHFANIVKNVWCNVILTYDGIKINAYLNGQYLGSKNMILNTTLTNFITVGSRNDGTTFFNGKIDDIAIYNRTLTQDEISKINTVNKNLCEQDKETLYNNGYVVGPDNKNCDVGIHLESKWVDTPNIESIEFTTLQHRNYDYTKVYDQNNNLIYQWNGISLSDTWYNKEHFLNIKGNSKIKIEFYQGFDKLLNGDKFCNGSMRITKMNCSAQTLGLNDIELNNSITVYPNPTTDFLNFNIDNEVNVKIFDLLGKLVINQNVTKQISLSELNKGLYLVEVSNNDIQYKTKIIKN